jgi:hypothetical protein
MKKIIVTLLLWLFCILGMQAQSNTVAVGGKATGSGGTASFTAGEVFYTYKLGSTASVTEGVQQSYLVLPTGVISGAATVCAGTSTQLSIAVTGQGPWFGTLSDGTGFSGSATPVLVTVTPTTTTTYTIATLSSETATATATDLSGSATVTVNQPTSYYADADGDGYGNAAVSVQDCVPPVNYVTDNTDCDDTKAAIHPGAVDICYDGIDNDCDGIVDNDCVPLVSTIQTAQCGQTLAKIDDYVYANLVSGAQGYRFKVTNMVTNEVQTIDRFLRVFRITQLPNYAFNTEYKVEVAVRKFNTWQPTYGAPCTVKTPVATTQLINCGASLTAMTDVIYANSVQYATGYQFKVTNVLNPLDTRTINRSLREFRMSLLSGIQYNTTYTVEVAVRNTDGVTYLPYGPVCEVTTPNFPASYLQDSQCDDYVVPSNATILYAQSFTGAEGYRFRLQNGGQGYSQEVDRYLRTVRLSDFTGLTAGATYTVKVALKINGVWGSFTGKSCSIITPGGAPARIDEETVVVKGNFAAVAYPNPFANTFAIQVQTTSTAVIQMKVYDMLGRLVEQLETNTDTKETTMFGERYPSGVYNVVVTQGGITETLRVIKR